MRRSSETKIWKKLLAVMLTVVMVLSCMPLYEVEAEAAETSGDYEYVADKDGTGVEIRKYKGSGGDVVIPSKIDGKKVTGIGDGVFYDCSGLASVVIPDSVTSIGSNAFEVMAGGYPLSLPELAALIQRHREQMGAQQEIVQKKEEKYKALPVF